MHKVMLILFLLVNCAAVAAQKPQKVPSKEATAPTTGELTGFVFAVTKGGDLKPARLATVILLWFSVVQNAETENSTGNMYQRNGLKQMHNVVAKLASKANDDNFCEQDSCQTQLVGYITALRDTLRWATEQRKPEQIKTAEADEEGRFKITGLPAGRYTLVVTGQAGVNSAFWDTDVVVTAGQTTSVKLSSPKRACVQQ
jgi:Carboxypeptidase regulatory-like domain